jgi:hypothetical protein
MFLLILALISFKPAHAEQDLRSKIGSVFSAPVSYRNKLYFTATTGVLYESDAALTKISKLFEGKMQTLGSLVVSGDRLYWGDGLHSDLESNFYVYDLKERKLVHESKMKGHFEREPLIENGKIYLPSGPAGIMAMDAKTFKIDWNTRSYQEKTLHIDSNLITYKNSICGTTIYDLKGIICFDQKSGKVARFAELKRDPKSEIRIAGNHLLGFATDADMVKSKWDIPADFYSYNLETGKFTVLKELRGFNFFAPAIKDQEAFVTLSTGDFLTLGIEDGKISFLGEFPEPFINPPFMNGDQFCSVGIMGKILCFTKSKTGSLGAISFDKRIVDTIIGKASLRNGDLYLPTRTGYAKQSLK